MSKSELTEHTLILDLQLRIRALEDDLETLLAGQATNLGNMIRELQEAVADLKGEPVGMMFTIPRRPSRPIEDYVLPKEESE